MIIMELRELQKRINEFIDDKNIDTTVETRMIDLVNELGELCKEILIGNGYGKKQFAKTEDWKNEIGDVLFSLILLANSTKTDMEDALTLVLEKYEKRYGAKGHIDSGG